MTHSHSTFLGLFIKGVLAGIVYGLGTVFAGMLAAAFHVTLPNFQPPGSASHSAFSLFWLVCPLLGLSLVPLALHTGGSRLLRGLALFFLIFICLGITMVMEAKIFLTLYAHGGAFGSIFVVFPPALLCGLALSFLLAQDQPEMSAKERLRSFFAAHSPFSWAVRFVLAILAFAVAYFLFGSMVAPFVVPFYRAGLFGLTLPPFSVILPVLFARSALFLLACLPFLILWTRSRVSLILSLGLAHWFLTGLFGLLQVFFWPLVMRIAHSLEIGADSFAYAAALVFLLLPRQSESSVPAPAHVAPQVP